ncbi:tetratricopeptide repeat protein [Niveibacterium sp.]|uniref:tetratricopeptide repeat protein n=1 Tax=Niveibacterium sp. TaxID=2017444 RepID=UPI0035AFF230
MHKISGILLAASLFAGLAQASGGGGGGGSTVAEVPELVAAQGAIDKSDWDAAIGILTPYVAGHPRSADGLNLLGYASRKQGKLDNAFRYYEQALTIDPKHRGAHEYIGEAYLMAGDLAHAEQHLAALDKLCWLPCEEYDDLKAAIADYRAKHP